MAATLEGQVLVRVAGEGWGTPDSLGFLGEAELQTVLFEQPSLIPGVSVEARAVRELSTGVGPSDVVVIDTDGSLTVVECKLASNAEVRRKIVGQVLDYAARLWRTPLEEVDTRWRSRSGGSGLLDGLDDAAVTALRASLADGAFRLVLAVDEINDDLQQIVEYLNTHTSAGTSVLALELRRASHHGVDILVPRTFGGELAQAKERESGRSRRASWTMDDVRGALAEVDGGWRSALDQLVADLGALGCTPFGTRAQAPSLGFALTLPAGTVYPYTAYASPPTLQVNFQWLSAASDEGKEAFLTALDDVPGIDATAVREAAFAKRPNLPFVLVPSAHESLVSAVEHLVRASAS